MTSSQLAPTRTQDPNQFVLNGANLKVRFALDSAEGEPHLRYQDSNQIMDFFGEQIFLESTAVGVLATVTTLDTEGIGHSTFSLIIPAVDVSAGPQTVATIGMTTLHRTRPSSMTRGQQRTFHITELRGSARHLDF